ncbi:MAG TPA: MASE3 domain-containing protein [Bacteroidales bacterium]|nr:MASE3 domain-containing protein [Bacteroidales bacterium]
MISKRVIVKYVIPIILISGGILALHSIEKVNYLLFHTLIEFFSIIVAFSLFIITLNSRRMLDNNYLLFFGIASLFIGFLDLMHVITYAGMNIIPPGNFYANQFWVATRILESLTLITGFLFLSRNIKPWFWFIFGIYTVITALIILSILVFKNFPSCYIEGVGQTKFKIYSEYLIILILFAALLILRTRRSYFEKDIYYYIGLSIAFTILSEYMFTLYYSNFGLFNQLGHYFKLLSFILIYKANIETGFIRPTRVIYNSLVKSQDDIDRINQELREQVATRDKFFSIIAHDLRSPLASIIMASEVMHKKVVAFKPETITRYADNIYNISKNTFTLLENLLEWSRFKSGAITVTFSTFNLKDIVNRVLSLYHQTAVNKNIEIISGIDSNTHVYADIDMVNAVLRNLISNALKFTPEGGRISVRSEDAGDFIQVRVSDTGTGIKPEKLTNLFDVAKVHSERGTANEKGTGLGLVLCKDFVNENGGIITVESNPGQGSTFIFTLKKEPHHDS